MYYISRDAQLQRKLQREVDSAFAQQKIADDDDGGAMPIAILAQLPLVKSAMLEALRLRPTVVVVSRLSSRPFQFPGSDVVVPANTIVSACNLSMGMNKEVWGDDVDAYRPERHLESEVDVTADHQVFDNNNNNNNKTSRLVTE